MTDLQERVQHLRARPLLLLCRTPKGKEQTMTLEECRRTGSAYIHIVADDLDQLLSAALNARAAAPGRAEAGNS